jgi:hypothetical protein
VQCMAGALGQLLDVEVPVLGKLPHLPAFGSAVPDAVTIRLLG